MPFISIIVPCYNEEASVGDLLGAIHAQSYPRGDLEVVIADGMSTDGTREKITAFSASHPDLRLVVVDNPQGCIPAGLNHALKQARGEIIIRLDAHSIPHGDYVERCVADLELNLGENVGGVWEIHPGAPTWMAKSIAAAAAHPLAVGDAHYRHAKVASAVDTVPFGAFKRELLALVGFFDETLLTNEDYEFNARIRKAGGTIWLDPSIRSGYIARADLPSLAKQYFRYGFWKWRMLQRYPDTLRWRQALPPLFVLSLAVLLILAIFLPIFWFILGVELGLYLLIIAITGLAAALQTRQPTLVIGLPLAILTMHIAWGGGFLWSMIKMMVSGKDLQKK